MKKNQYNLAPFVIVFLVFLILKLTGVVNWSWWWITAPLWAPIALLLILLVLFYYALFFARKIKENEDRQQ